MPKFKEIGIDLDVSACIEQARRSFRESENDILRRLLLASTQHDASPGQIAMLPDVIEEPRARRTGNWTVELLGDRHPATSLKDAYKQMLILLAHLDGGFLAAFGKESSRSRRFIARAPKELYGRAPHLAKDHARPLIDGWFYDSNLSADQVGRRLRIAARLSRIPYGPKLRIMEDHREI